MFYFIRMIWSRFQALRHTRLEGNESTLFFHRNVRFILSPGSEIIIRDGGLRIGYPASGAVPYASYPNTVIQLGRGARLICDGAVAIAPGATIRVSDGGTLRFGGANLVAHNLTALCSREISIGRGAQLSWNVTLIDDDGHQFTGAHGKKLRRIYRPLRIGRQVGIQMNVLIPSGVSIGDRAVIAAGTVLRQDVPEECTAYTESQLRIKEGFMASARVSLEQAILQ